jgi:hypothetical protein
MGYLWFVSLLKVLINTFSVLELFLLLMLGKLHKERYSPSVFAMRESFNINSFLAYKYVVYKKWKTLSKRMRIG